MPKKQLRVWLPDDWADISEENPEGPATFCWTDEKASGAFQVSTAEYDSGDVPMPDEEALVQFAVNFGNDRQWGELKNAFAGDIPFGKYGSAVFEKPNAAEDESPYSQIWCLCNGSDFIFATFFAQNPSQPELDAAQLVAEGLDFS
jgi:hypothetical protein